MSAKKGNGLVIAALAILVAVGMSLFPATASAKGTPKFVSIGTASPAGAYYPLGVAMAQIWNKTIPGIHFNAQQTGGSVANLNELNSGALQVGFANANIVWKALQGKPPFKHKVHVYGGWVLNASYGVFVVKRSSGIKTVADLRGKKVSLGAPGSSANVIAKRVLASQGLKPGDYHAVFLGWQESADALSDGSISAAFMIGGQPLPAISSLAVRTPVRILTFAQAKLAAQGGFPLSVAKTPKDLYKTRQPGDEIVVPSLVLLGRNVPASLAYKMVKSVFSAIPTLKAANASGAEAQLIKPNDAKRLGLTIHPGVLRFQKEMQTH